MKKSKPIQHNFSSREEIAKLDKEQLVDAVFHLSGKVQQLSDIVRDFVLAKHGPKTEKFQNPAQLNIFSGSTQAEPQPDTTPTPEASDNKNNTKSSSKKSGHSRNPLPEGLPRNPINGELKNPNCACCGTVLQFVRKILQNSRLQFIPASFHIEDLYTQVFSCPECKGEEVFAKVSEPVENGIAGAGLLAQVAVSKGTDHLPFNRQSTIYERSGVQLSRSTLSDLFAHTAGILLPLYDYMHAELLKSKVVCTDDTPVKVKDRKKDKNIKTGRLWIYLGDKDHPYNLFDYTTGRGRDGPMTFLKMFKGFLQGDCFSGNLAVCAAAGTILVACLAHARRYFIKAMLNDKQGCNHALAIFQSLYEIERTAKELELEAPALKIMRQEEAVPILNKFQEWMLEQYKAAQAQSTYSKALFYCLNNWNELSQYVIDGDLSIDNNISEREMKYIAMGRRAWLFLGSDTGGKNHAIVLSLLSTCRRHGVEPWAYLTDVIERLTDGSEKNLEDLLPNKWKPRSRPANPAGIDSDQVPQKTVEIQVDPEKALQTAVLKNAG